MNILDLPYNRHLGLATTQFGDREVVCLEPQEHHLNHLGTIHASAVYSLAEAASGHALLTEIGLRPDSVLAVVRSAKVKYRRPASHGLIALATISIAQAASFLQQLQTKRRGFIDVNVRVIQGDAVNAEEVFQGVFSWFASQTAHPQE